MATAFHYHVHVKSERIFLYEIAITKWSLTGCVQSPNSHRWERLRLSFRKKTAFPSLGHSCKEIRNTSSHLKDGEYWIALKKKGSLLKVYCDMTTDGGREGMFKKK